MPRDFKIIAKRNKEVRIFHKVKGGVWLYIQATQVLIMYFYALHRYVLKLSLTQNSFGKFL